jgi:hypothetical protein
MQQWHITLSSPRRAHLFPDEPRRRAAVCAIVRVASDCLLLFCVVDDHVHINVVCTESRMRLIRRSLVLSLSSLAGQRLVSHTTLVENRAHLVRLVAYFLKQPGHHGLDFHPAIWSGSCFQDLIGARCIAGFTSRLSQELPRMREEELYSIVGLPPKKLEPAGRDAVRSAGAQRIVAACAAAVGTGPELVGRTASVAAARQLSVQLGQAAGIARAELAWALGLTPQRIGQLAVSSSDTRRIRAARLQLALEDAVGAPAIRTTTG